MATLYRLSPSSRT
jgi:hypothetical protein